MGDMLNVAVKVTYMHAGRDSFVRDGTLDNGLCCRHFTPMSRDSVRGIYRCLVLHTPELMQFYTLIHRIAHSAAKKSSLRKK